MRKNNMKIILLNNFIIKLSGVLMILSIEINLLFIQALLAYEIKNHQLIHEINFHQLDDSKIIAKDSHKDKTSYLIWVQDKNTLVNKTTRRISEKDHKRDKKNYKKSKQVINIKITY